MEKINGVGREAGPDRERVQSLESEVTIVIQNLKRLLEKENISEAKAAVELLHQALLNMCDLIEKQQRAIDLLSPE
jgi:hypothetical protein